MAIDNVVITPLPATEPPKPDEVKPEDLQGLTALALSSLGFSDTEKKTPEKPAEKKVEEKPKEPTAEEKAAADAAAKQAEEAAAKSKEEAEKKKVTKVTKPAPLDPNLIAEQAADLALSKRQQAEKKNEPETPEVDADDQRLRDVFKVMAENPANAGLPQQLENFLVKEKGYRSKWEQANPGKEFDASSEDHADFYEKHEPQYDDREFNRAEARLEARLEYTKERQERERQELKVQAERQASERVTAATASSVKSLIEAVAPELSKEEGMDLAKLEEKDPVAAVIVQGARAEMIPLVREANRLLSGTIQSDLNNPVHVDVLTRVQKQEAYYAGQPAQETNYMGKRFATGQQWSQMSKGQQAQYWTIWNHPELVTPVLVNEFSSAAKARIDKIRPTLAQAKDHKLDDKAKTPEVTPAKPAVDKPAAPNTSHQSDKGSGSDDTGKPPENLSASILNALFS